MNDTIYKQVLEPYIEILDRKVLQQKDRWYIPIKRLFNNDQYCGLLTDIILHTGRPCCRRYCICRYLDIEDKCHFYRQTIRFQKKHLFQCKSQSIELLIE